MTPEVAALVGAAIGAAVTLALGFIGRIWQSRDARAASRREFVKAITERLQRIVKAGSRDELVALNHEMFNAAALGVYVPRGEEAVHIWYTIRDVRILQLALDSEKNGGKQQADVFDLSIDTMSDLRGWARGEWKRGRRWFRRELRTTEQPWMKKIKEVTDKDKAAKAAAKAAEG